MLRIQARGALRLVLHRDLGVRAAVARRVSQPAPVANALALVLAATLALVLAPEYGADGAAVATVVGEGGLAVALGVLLMCAQEGPPCRSRDAAARCSSPQRSRCAVLLVPGLPDARRSRSWPASCTSSWSSSCGPFRDEVWDALRRPGARRGDTRPRRPRPPGQPLGAATVGAPPGSLRGRVLSSRGATSSTPRTCRSARSGSARAGTCFRGGGSGDIAMGFLGDRYRDVDEEFARADVVHAAELSFWFSGEAARLKSRARATSSFSRSGRRSRSCRHLPKPLRPPLSRADAGRGATCSCRRPSERARHC